MLQDDSAVKYAYPDQLEEIGQALSEMHASGVLGSNPEEFVENLEQFRSKMPGVEDFAQFKKAVAGDIADLYGDDHLEFVCQVMPLIPDQDGYSYDVKERWYKDGELVAGGQGSEASDNAAAGRLLDEEKGLYYDDENWYDENGVPLEWDEGRKLYAAGERWYDENFVALTWSDANNLYYDSSNNWFDQNGFPLTWYAEQKLYVGADDAWYDENLVPLEWVDGKNLYRGSDGNWFDENGNPLEWVQEGESGHYLASSGARYDADANPLQDIPAAAQPVEAQVGTDIAALLQQALADDDLEFDPEDLADPDFQEMLKGLLAEQLEKSTN